MAATAKKKSYFKKDSSNESKDPSTKKKGDLNGDGKVDWIDFLLGIVEFIQTPRGQTFVVIFAATFSAAINIGSYYKTTSFLLGYLHAEWMAPFAWLLAILIWAVFQVGEVMPRTGFWDFATKVQVMSAMQGSGVTIKDKSEGQQTDLVYWQETVMNDAKMRRSLFFFVSVMAHVGDVAMLWSDYPLFDSEWMPIVINFIVCAFLVFSFEVLVGLAQSLKQLRKGYAI
jgi:hypothetical protein